MKIAENIEIMIDYKYNNCSPINYNLTKKCDSMKKTAIFLICAAFLFSLVGCNTKYSADEFIGKSSAQIEAEFGAFDCCGMPVSEDGLYRNTACGYTIKEPNKTFWGTDPEVLFFIIFNESGIAVACEKGHRPGG